MDWASHPGHLESILLEFDADQASKEFDIIQYFRKWFKPSIKAWMEQHGRGLGNSDNLVKKTINAVAKSSL